MHHVIKADQRPYHISHIPYQTAAAVVVVAATLESSDSTVDVFLMID